MTEVKPSFIACMVGIILLFACAIVYPLNGEELEGWDLVLKDFYYFDFNTMENYIASVEGKDTAVLEKHLNGLEDSEKVLNNWNIIQKARTLQSDVLVYTPVEYVIEISSTIRERDKEIELIKDMENDVFHEKYGFYYHSIFTGNAKDQNKRKEWRETEDYEKYRNLELEIFEEYQKRLRELEKNYKNNIGPLDRRLDKLQEHVLRQKHALRSVIDSIKKELAIRRGEFARSAKRLNLTADNSVYSVSRDGVVKVVITIEGGKPGYRLLITDLESGEPRRLNYGIATEHEISFSFNKAGTQTRYLVLEDNSFPAQQSRLTLTFQVGEAELSHLKRSKESADFYAKATDMGAARSENLRKAFAARKRKQTARDKAAAFLSSGDDKKKDTQKKPVPPPYTPPKPGDVELVGFGLWGPSGQKYVGDRVNFKAMEVFNGEFLEMKNLSGNARADWTGSRSFVPKKAGTYTVEVSYTYQGREYSDSRTIQIKERPVKK